MLGLNLPVSIILGQDDQFQVPYSLSELAIKFENIAVLRPILPNFGSRPANFKYYL